MKVDVYLGSWVCGFVDCLLKRGLAYKLVYQRLPYISISMKLLVS